MNINDNLGVEFTPKQKVVQKNWAGFENRTWCFVSTLPTKKSEELTETSLDVDKIDTLFGRIKENNLPVTEAGFTRINTKTRELKVALLNKLKVRGISGQNLEVKVVFEHSKVRVERKESREVDGKKEEVSTEVACFDSEDPIVKESFRQLKEAYKEAVRETLQLWIRENEKYIKGQAGGSFKDRGTDPEPVAGSFEALSKKDADIDQIFTDLTFLTDTDGVFKSKDLKLLKSVYDSYCQDPVKKAEVDKFVFWLAANDVRLGISTEYDNAYYQASDADPAKRKYPSGINTLYSKLSKCKDMNQVRSEFTNVGDGTCRVAQLVGGKLQFTNGDIQAAYEMYLNPETSVVENNLKEIARRMKEQDERIYLLRWHKNPTFQRMWGPISRALQLDARFMPRKTDMENKIKNEVNIIMERDTLSLEQAIKRFEKKHDFEGIGIAEGESIYKRSFYRYARRLRHVYEANKKNPQKSQIQTAMKAALNKAFDSLESRYLRNKQGGDLTTLDAEEKKELLKALAFALPLNITDPSDKHLMKAVYASLVGDKIKDEGDRAEIVKSVDKAEKMQKYLYNLLRVNRGWLWSW